MQAVRDGTRWMLRLEDGQDLFETISGFAQRENIRAGAVVFGIGMFRRVAFGYWDGSQYQVQELTVPHEVVVRIPLHLDLEASQRCRHDTVPPSVPWSLTRV